ncbi:MAG: hypothetical protein UV80_C0004G0064 [Candidatus Peregrinibacteria bacterium GW2011_GWF2_43_17]|nr:MAG: hypothetical protein UV80_C0004G0064 [Candidatus Peregrinibacteria bacterium GW2011_GWF2_43_17]
MDFGKLIEVIEEYILGCAAKQRFEDSTPDDFVNSDTAKKY